MIGLKPSHMEELPEGIIKIIHTESVEELACWYSAADIYVNLTYGDTFPTTNLEAIACGTPVVTYATGGSPESAVLYGASVPKGDLNALLDALRRSYEPSEGAKPSCLDAASALQAYLLLY